MVYANAGHDYPLVYIHEERKFEECESTGRALGMIADEVYDTRKVTLGYRDLIVLFTDGITEARRRNLFFGPERLREVIANHAEQSAGELVASIFDEVKEFTGGELRDDAGVLVIKALPVSQ